jgi:hypothetical protein
MYTFGMQVGNNVEGALGDSCGEMEGWNNGHDKLIWAPKPIAYEATICALKL